MARPAKDDYVAHHLKSLLSRRICLGMWEEMNHKCGGLLVKRANAVERERVVRC